MHRPFELLRKVQIDGHGFPQHEIAVHESGDPSVRVQSKVFSTLQLIGSGGRPYQLIWFARLLEHPQASHRPRSRITVELKHWSAPKHTALDCTSIRRSDSATGF